MYVGTLSVALHALDVTLDEDVARLFAGQNVDVVERHFVRVPDDAAQLVTTLSQNTDTPIPSSHCLIVVAK